MDVVDHLFVAMFDSLNNNFAKELEAVRRQYPFEPLKVIIYYEFQNLGILWLQHSVWYMMSWTLRCLYIQDANENCFMFIHYNTCGLFRNYIHFASPLACLNLKTNFKFLYVQYLRQTLRLTFEEGIQMLKVMIMHLSSAKKG